jgi:hypothetical protein
MHNAFLIYTLYHIVNIVLILVISSNIHFTKPRACLLIYYRKPNLFVCYRTFFLDILCVYILFLQLWLIPNVYTVKKYQYSVVCLWYKYVFSLHRALCDRILRCVGPVAGECVGWKMFGWEIVFDQKASSNWIRKHFNQEGVDLNRWDVKSFKTRRHWFSRESAVGAHRLILARRGCIVMLFRGSPIWTPSRGPTVGRAVCGPGRWRPRAGGCLASRVCQPGISSGQYGDWKRKIGKAKFKTGCRSWSLSGEVTEQLAERDNIFMAQ